MRQFKKKSLLSLSLSLSLKTLSISLILIYPSPTLRTPDFLNFTYSKKALYGLETL